MESTHSTETRSVLKRRDTLGQLWQAPVFCIGLTALLGMGTVHSLCWDGEAKVFEHRLKATRQALTASPPQVRQALELGETLLPACRRFAPRAGEVHFLVGSSYVLLAGEADEAVDLWQQARNHLEQAEQLGVPDSERSKLLFRLGKTYFHVGEEPARVISYLQRSVEDAGEEAADGFGMLAQLYLRLQFPDVQAALEASKRQLAMPTDNDELLAPARLLHGEILLRLKQPAQARKTLARIGPSTAPAVYAKARYLQAQSCQDEGMWSEAAQLWEEILGERERAGEQGRVYWYLGVCYRELGKTDEAARAWESAESHGGEVGQAACLGLADLRGAGKTPAVAFACYERALRNLAEPYQNSLLEMRDLRRLLEQGCTRYRESGDFDRSMRLAGLYEKLALPGVAAELRGQAADAWAQECRSAHHEQQARVHALEAGQAYEAVAEAHRDKPDHASWLWRSADRYMQAQDYGRALVALKKFLDSESSPEQLAEAWFSLAQAYLKLHDGESAVAAFRKCIEFSGPFAFRARFQLAQHDIEQGRLDDAEETLKQNLELMRLTPDDETYKASLFSLGALLYQRGNVRSAAQRYQEALDRYPADARALEARFQLADCYRRLAALENQNLRIELNLTQEVQRHYRDQYRLWLQMALAHYQKLADDLAARQSTGPLPAKEESILRSADFALGECRIDLGHYENAIRHYEILAARYHHQAEHLLALRQIWRCYWMMREPERARQTVKQVGAVLSELDEKIFTSPGSQSRQDWKTWLDWAAKQ